jgi:hypothetical protein
LLLRKEVRLITTNAPFTTPIREEIRAAFVQHLPMRKDSERTGGQALIGPHPDIEQAFVASAGEIPSASIAAAYRIDAARLTQVS